MDAEQDGRWLPRAEAAHVLGVHERTMRRQVAAGRYRTRREGQTIEVWLPAGAHGRALPSVHDALGAQDVPPTPDQGIAQAAHGHHRDGALGNRDDLAQLLREQIEGRLRAEQAAAMWQERARNLEIQVEQLLALPAHEEEPPRWRWWERWRRG